MTTNTAAADLATLRTELARLTSKSDKCSALALDSRAPEGERNAAWSRAMELDWKAAKVATAIYRATRKR